jgi:hypothetical protein
MKLTFSYAWAGMALILAGLIGCDRDTSRSANKQSASPASAPTNEPTTRECATTAPAIDESDPRRLDARLSESEQAFLYEEGAKHEAKRLFLPQCAVSGDDYFYRFGYHGPIRQCREVTLAIVHFSTGSSQPGPEPLTEIDRLNEVLWRGTVSFRCKAYRFLDEDWRTQTKTWQEWAAGNKLENGHFFYTELVLKKNGWTTNNQKADKPDQPIELRTLPGVAVAPMSSPCNPRKVTLANYDSIIVYMPIKRVKGILGPWSDVEIQDSMNMTIHWSLGDGVSGISVQFTDGRVFMKSRRGFGLAPEKIMNPGMEKLRQQ